MQRLFQSFERSGVDYLLISGQAAVLYGAATFSEDIDLWVRPSSANSRRLLRALSLCGARVHKLTPPLTLRNLRAALKRQRKMEQKLILRMVEMFVLML